MTEARLGSCIKLHQGVQVFRRRTLSLADSLQLALDLSHVGRQGPLRLLKGLALLNLVVVQALSMSLHGCGGLSLVRLEGLCGLRGSHLGLVDLLRGLGLEALQGRDVRLRSLLHLRLVRLQRQSGLLGQSSGLRLLLCQAFVNGLRRLARLELVALKGELRGLGLGLVRLQGASMLLCRLAGFAPVSVQGLLRGLQGSRGLLLMVIEGQFPLFQSRGCFRFVALQTLLVGL
mmetsp:Transcript_71930/g.156185  ORF Transcript_71930/g.156185 Transcript_71930/m.156185 type:complete len:232 (-) Transcript_71930:114-809(-)